MPTSLTPQLLVAAYAQGVFPMAEENGDIFWYDPDPRAILPLDTFHIPRSLARTLRQAPYEIRINADFTAVIRACAAPGPGREETWIDDQIVNAYTQLHRLGLAHSVEAWCNGRLAGGLYGVALRGLFAGESMFSHRRDASKVALVALVERLRVRRFTLLDIQFMTDHLRQFGALEIERSAYQVRLAAALTVAVQFDDDRKGVR